MSPKIGAATLGNGSPKQPEACKKCGKKVPLNPDKLCLDCAVEALKKKAGV